MFGKHLEPAEATVLYAEINAASSRSYDFILDVRTATGQVFRAEKKKVFILYMHPKAGDIIKVKYNPKNMHVELDLEGDLRYDVKAKEAATKARHDAILAARPGTPLPQDRHEEARQAHFHPGGQAVGALNLDELLSKAMSSGAAIIQINGTQQPFATDGSQGQTGQAQMALMQNALLRAELQSNGATGTATILHIEDTGMTFPPLIAQQVTVRVQETSNYQTFECTFTAWVDTRKEQLYVGTTLTVRYDPSHHDKIIFQH